MRRKTEAFFTFGFKASASLLYCMMCKKLNSCERLRSHFLPHIKQCAPITKTNSFTVMAKHWLFVLRLVRHKT